VCERVRERPDRLLNNFWHFKSLRLGNKKTWRHLWMEIDTPTKKEMKH